MTERLDLWRRIDRAFEQDSAEDVEGCLEQLGVDKSAVPETLNESVGALIKQAFGDDSPTAEIGGSRYRVLERLNSGGQGEVYLAERADGVYSRTVVIKLLGAQPDADLHQQLFKREMQLLADLPHPGIVQILDGGISSAGQPWLVLEHIDGPDLEHFTRANPLATDDVVRLMRDLCDSLHFVHLRGVVHMDIKPGNVMLRDINGVRYPVLIDFGIALRAAGLGDARRGAVFGTPGFAAPEQLAGEPVDARADIYSLGMLLAWLLTGGEAVGGNRQSGDSLNGHLKSAGVPQDLRDVVRRCTHADPDRRFATAEALRTDLVAWLNDLPLAASRHRLLHVLSKTVRRHSLAFSIAALALLGAVLATMKYTADVTALQSITQTERVASDNLFNFMLDDLFERLQQIGRIDLLEIVAQRSVEHLQRQDQRALDATSRLQSAQAFYNAGQVFDELEQSQQAQAALDDAKTVLQPVAADSSYREQWLGQMARIGVLESQTLATEGQQAQTEAALKQALDYSKQLLEANPSASRETLWESQLQLGWHYMEYNQPEAALTALRGSLDTARQQAGQTGNARWLMNVSQSWQALAWHAYDYGETSAARHAAEKAIEAAEQALAREDNIEYQHNLRIVLNQHAFMLTQEEQFAAAQQRLERAVAIGRELQLQAPRNREYQREHAYALTTAGEAAERDGDLQTALDLYQEALAISREIAKADQQGFSAANDFAVDLVSVGNTLVKLGRRADAQPYFEQAAALMEPVVESEPENKYYLYTQAVALIRLGHHDQVQPLINVIVAAEMDDQPFRDLLAEYQLQVE